MAVGQLSHYTRHTPGVLRKAILLPEKPDGELLAFAADMGMEVMWAGEDAWCTTAQWAHLLGMKRIAPRNSR